MDLLDDIRKQINDRLAELRPLTGEYERLQQVHAALSAPDETDNAVKRSGRGPGTASAGARRTAPRGSAREKILAAARDNPEAKRGDIAKATGLSPNTVGSTLSKLRADGLLPRSQRSRAAATPDATTEPAATTDTPIAEPPAEAASAASDDGPQEELQSAHTPEDADQPEAASEPGEAQTAAPEPAKRKATKGRPRPAKAPSG